MNASQFHTSSSVELYFRKDDEDKKNDTVFIAIHVLKELK